MPFFLRFFTTFCEIRFPSAPLRAKDGDQSRDFPSLPAGAILPKFTNSYVHFAQKSPLFGGFKNFLFGKKIPPPSAPIPQPPYRFCLFLCIFPLFANSSCFYHRQKMHNAKCRYHAQCRMQRAKCRGQNAEDRMQRTECRG